MSMSEAVVNSSPLLFRCVFVGDSSIFVTNIFSLILGISVAVLALPDGENIQYEKRPTCNCSTVDLGEISRAFLWETYGRKVRAGPECMQATRGHQSKATSWLAGARAGGFQPVTLLANVGNHARAAFSL